MDRTELGIDETLDVLFDEKIKFIQKKDGYRFSIDSILLSNFARIKEGERVLDIGSGCGVIPIYLEKRGIRAKFLGVEIQRELFELSERNRILNLCKNVEFVLGDIRMLVESLKREPFDVVISNPPYRKEGSGRRSPKESKDLARSERELKLDELLHVSRSLLKEGGRLYLIFPAVRIPDLVYNARSSGLEPKRMRFVHSRVEEEATLVLVEMRKGGRVGCKVERPLIIYEENEYSEEVKSYYRI